METSLHEYIVCSTDAGQINSPAFYDCVIHLICTAGNAVFAYNEQRFELVKGNIAVLTHPRMVRLESVTEDFQCEYLAAPEKFLHNLLPVNNYSIQGGVSLFSNPVIDVNEEEARIFLGDIANIRKRIDDIDHLFYSGMIGSLLQTMIYDLFDFHARRHEGVLTTDRVGYVTSQFFMLIRSGHPAKHREVSYYASQLNVSPKYLSDTIKRVTGESVSTHINRAAATVMYEYLKDNTMSVTQIADEMNFTSVSYFSRYCKKYIGKSPARLRTGGVKSV
ncbi:MAG: helix-turn-helix domain-containing protein [Duncaniella sp.]|nr:helix-turn-helix domain-containing protein [Duncaniella sp.]